jgi:hypothetical protein
MRSIGGALLLALAAFMFVGYMRADVGGPAALFALLITVVLPAAGGLALLTGARRGGPKLAARREQLRRDTLQAELLRLAAARHGRLTIVEAVTELAITPEEAKDNLDALALRDLADFEVTDSGIVVYVFHDVQRLDDKHHSKGLLE